jgi:peptidoglycan/LPS O-acetylase OafA/YrhL
MSGDRRRIPSLDGVRAISVAIVLLGHVCNSTGAPAWLAPMERYANFGVRVFFVLSGFLITSLLVKERERTGQVDLKAFYIRRSFRIFPAAYVFLAVIGMTAWASLRATDLVIAATYLSNYHTGRPWILGPLWSLAVEEQFYLLWPIAVALWFHRRVEILVAVLLAAPVVRGVLVLTGHGIGQYSWFLAVMDALASGCLLAVLRPQLEPWSRALESRWMLLVPLSTLGLVQLGRLSSTGYQVLVLPVVHLGIALTIDHVIRRPYQILNWGPVAWLGTLSYSLYLWQQPFLAPAAPEPWTRFPQNLLLALALAVASYYSIEKPVLDWRQRRAAATGNSRALSPHTEVG